MFDKLLCVVNSRSVCVLMYADAVGSENCEVYCDLSFETVLCMHYALCLVCYILCVLIVSNN